jgi:colicin import membrane protein
METSDTLSQAEELRFQQMIGASVVAHILFALAFVFLRPDASRDPLIKREQAITVDLMMVSAEPAAASRKQRGLPDKESFEPIPEKAPPKEVDKKEPDKLEPEPPKEKAVPREAPREDQSIADALKKAPSPPPDPSVDEAGQEAMNRALARLKARERVAKLNSSDSGSDQGSDASGSGIGRGGSNVGTDPSWASALNEKISDVWIVLPSWMNKNLHVDVNVKLDAEGNLRDVSIANSSGDQGFDGAAVRAIRKAAPLPLPTKSDLRSLVLTEGLTLGFTPKGLAK